jgi:hypothetical protein
MLENDCGRFDPSATAVGVQGGRNEGAALSAGGNAEFATEIRDEGVLVLKSTVGAASASISAGFDCSF